MASVAVKVSVAVALLGLALWVACGVLLGLFPRLIKTKLEKTLVLSEESITFEKWKNPSVPITFSVYVFNVTNPDEVFHNRSIKPILQEVGPYVFREKKRKNITGWDNENGTVDYLDYKAFHFIPELSVGDQTEMVYIINVPIAGLLKHLDKSVKSWMRGLVMPGISHGLMSHGEGMFIQRSVEEILFKGYKIKFFDKLAEVMGVFGDPPKMLPNNTFGLFYGKNGTVGVPYSVYTGSQDVSKFGLITSWKNMNTLPYWKTSYCNMINGTDGTIFPPFIDKSKPLYIFNGELCRTLFLTYVKESKVGNVDTYRFATSAELFADSIENPDNLCYCQVKMNGKCLEAGVLALGPCLKGSPIIASAPHFYLGSSNYTNIFEGLNPNGSLHETFVEVHPFTGAVLSAARRIQLNVLVEKSHKVYPFHNVTKPVIFPVIWLSEAATFNEDLLQKFTARIITPVRLANTLLPIGIALGIAVNLIGVIAAVYFWEKQAPKKKEVDLKCAYTAVSDGKAQPKDSQSKKPLVR